jgi:adenylate cyclase
MLQRRIPEATHYYEKAASLLESDFHSWGMLITCYRANGNKERVRYAAEMLVKRAKKALADDPTNGAALGLVASGLAILGEHERAKEWIDRAILIDPDNNNTRYNFGCVLANELDDPTAALNMLEPAFATCRVFMLKLAETDPDFDKIRDHPRFQKMMVDARQRLAIDASGAPTTPAGS